MTREHSRAFTLVELLVVITIIGVLVALLLPAVQAAREAARRVQCKNNVHQLALGALIHEGQHGFFPTGGWSLAYVGDADRGFGQDQTGGWAYNVLPYIEESSLHDLPADGRPHVITPEQRARAARLVSQPLAVLSCPSRRAPIASPLRLDVQFPKSGLRFANTDWPELFGRLDYAICGGEVHMANAGVDQKAFSEPENWVWCYDKLGNIVSPCTAGQSRFNQSLLTREYGITGVSFQRSEVGARHVTDGTASTYLIGEKFMDPVLYDVTEMRYEATWCSGFHHNGNNRRASWPPVQDQPYPFGDQIYVGLLHGFGSAHGTGCHMSFCDGSVRLISYDIERRVHQAAANRKDGLIVGD